MAEKRFNKNLCNYLRKVPSDINVAPACEKSYP